MYLFLFNTEAGRISGLFLVQMGHGSLFLQWKKHTQKKRKNCQSRAKLKF